jgi:HlyD family secretion protein
MRKAGIASVLGLAGLAVVIAIVASTTRPRTAAQVTGTGTLPEGWQAVAPGRVEPASGEIKVTPLIPGLVNEVLIKANDKVFAGEPLVKLKDDELQARLAASEAQVVMRHRARDDQKDKDKGKAVDLRRAEDAYSDAETDVFAARTILDSSAVARRVGGGSDADLKTARAALDQALERLKSRTAALRSAEAASPLPTQPDALLKAARAERSVARAAVEKLTIRAPIAGTVLQVNVRVGETATPSSPQPVLLLGDLSTLRVRAELDDRDVGNIKVGQPVTIRSVAFPGREFSGKVRSIAPNVEPASGASRGSRSLTDVDIVEVLIDLVDPGPLAPGTRVDAYFRRSEPGK